jgi:hypothetical protein
MPNGKLQFKTLQFKAKIEGKEAGVVAAIAPPIDVPEVFGTRARADALRRPPHDACE